jgi:hypothetical protein
VHLDAILGNDQLDALLLTVHLDAILGNDQLDALLLTVHLDAILGNDQLDALFLNVFILCLYMFRAASAHHHEGQSVSIHHLV